MLTRQEWDNLYVKVMRDRDTTTLRKLVITDLYFLLTCGCRRRDLRTDFHFARCQEIQTHPDGYLDLWFREAGKSSIITFGKTIQDILSDPEVTIGIFSHTRPIAKSFLSVLKREFEINVFLKELFPEVLYADPAKEAPVWSLDSGIVVKRRGNPKEATIEAHGLVDGQPTSKHYQILLVDDAVTRESVTSPEMIEKTTDAWRLALNLGAERTLPDGTKQPCRKRYIGTRYHYNDTYKTMMDCGAVKVREYYPTDLGKKDTDVVGNPVLFSQEYLLEKRKTLGLYTYGTQMLMDPTADKAAGFNIDWLEYYTVLKKHERWNFYLIVDPASEKKKSSDYSVFVVIGLADDNNYYLVDAVRDKMNLTERTAKLFDLHRKWQPKNTGYEKYGMQADIEHIYYIQEQEGYRFKVTPLGGSMPKNDRIRRLVPIFEQRRFYIPAKLLYVTAEKKAADFVQQFVDDEYVNFPVSAHDDCLKKDALIKTSRGYKYIQDVKEGDLVYTHMKRYKKVRKAICKPFNGKFYTFKGPGQLGIELSEDHKLYYTATDYRDYKETKCGKYGWIEASGWKKKYRNVIPIEKMYFRDNEYKIRNKQDHGYLCKNTSLVMDKDFCFILGYFLAEGHAHRSEKWQDKHMIQFASHARESDKRDKIKALLDKMGIKYKETIKGNCAIVRLSSRIFWEMFSKCYDVDKEKIVPEFAYTKEINLFSMLDGWISGDGWTLKNRDNYDQYCGSTSRKLCLAMRDIALSRGWYATMQQMKRHRFGKQTKDFYQLNIMYENKPVFEKGKYNKRLRLTENNEYASYLKRSQPYDYVGDVYDLQVEDDNSFVANGFIIHNCLDCLARITDEDMQAVFPKMAPPKLPVWEDDEKYDPMAVPK